MSGTEAGGGSVLLGLGIALAGALLVLAMGQGTRGAAVAGFATAAAMVLGFGAGVMAPVALFVLGGGFLTRLGRERKELARASEPNRGRRGVSNVIAKLGLPAALGLAAAARPEAAGPLALAAAACLAGAFADTAATETGPLAGGTVWSLGPGGMRASTHGMPGGVSVAGLLAAAVAAATAALAAWGAGLLSAGGATIVASAGFVASLAESAVAGSWLGARLGHFGRNVFVSSISALLAVIAGAPWGGGRWAI